MIALLPRTMSQLMVNSNLNGNYFVLHNVNLIELTTQGMNIRYKSTIEKRNYLTKQENTKHTK